MDDLEFMDKYLIVVFDEHDLIVSRSIFKDIKDAAIFFVDNINKYTDKFSVECYKIEVTCIDRKKGNK